MRILRLIVCGVLSSLTPLFAEADGPVDDVIPIAWQRFDSDLALEPDLRLAAEILLNNAHYNAGWIVQTLERDLAQDLYLPVNMAEHGIRPVASAIYGFAIVLKTGIFDEGKVGLSRRELTSRVTGLTRGLAATHKVNGGSDGWGDHWQSALWAGLAGQGGWMLWDELDPATRGMLAKLVEHEANRFIAPGYTVPYWNGQGGNTQAEENAWNSMVLQVAVAMMPGHPHARAWKVVCSELLVSAFSLETDMESDRSIDGRPVKEWLNGYNVREDGALINHNILHPDYMACVMQNLRAYITQSLAGDKAPEAAAFNADVVYETLIKRDFDSPPYREPGGTIYLPGKVELYYPNGNDWSYFRFDIYYATDSFAHVLGLAPGAGEKVEEWMNLRAVRLLEMQSRHEDRRVYADGEFDRYPGREQLVAWQIGDGFMVQWLEAQNALSEKGNWLD